MKTVKINAPAKINLALNVTGQNNGYHNLDMLVSTISVFDTVILSSRKDDKINLKVQSEHPEYFLEPENDNAYKTAKLFVEKFNTTGVDITVKKRIPIGGGLGGSSADIAGVLRGLKKLYNVTEDVKPLADNLGSDSGYLLTGGFARLKGRGEIVESLSIDKKLYLCIVVASGGVNTKECFTLFDEKGASGRADIDLLIENIKNYDGTEIKGSYNMLYDSAVEINPEVKRAYDETKSLSPSLTLMSGSGSSVYGVFESKELAKWAVDKLRRKFDKVLFAETVNLEETDKIIL